MDIINQEYDHTKKYKIRVNDNLLFTGNYLTARLGFTQREITPGPDERGAEYKSGETIYIQNDTGDHIYLRAITSTVNIEISEVTA